MKVCLVSREYPPETGYGGVGTYMSSVARALKQLGHSVFVVSFSKTEEYEYNDGNIRVFRIPLRLPLGFWRLGRWIPIWFLAYSAAVRSKLKQAHERFHFDIIQFPEWGGEAFFFARKPLCPFVIKVHGPLFLNHQFDRNHQPRVRQEIENWMERSTVLRANALIVSSKSMLNLTVNKWGIPAEKMTLIPNPIDLETFVPSHLNADDSKTDRGTHVLYVGRLESRKGVHILADAIPLILRRHPDVRFVFIGGDTNTSHDGGSFRAELEFQLRESRSSEATIFLGRRHRSELVPFYQQCNLFVMPSLYEPVGFTGLEAMACGKAVIASRNSGLAEWIRDGVSGLLVEPGSPGDLAEKIMWFLNLPEGMRQQMGVAARRAAEQFSLESVGRSLVDLYESVISNGQG